jgi:hypothetical protein
MKHLILAFLIAFGFFAAHADNITGTDPDRTIVALDGTKYEKVVVTGTDADGIRISYSDGRGVVSECSFFWYAMKSSRNFPSSTCS